MEERQKTNQNVFLPWKKDRKQTKMYFCHGRKTKKTTMETANINNIILPTA